MPFRRPVFETILGYLELDKVTILKGPWRTGKSTLIFQLIDSFLQKGVDPRRLLYLPFDDPDLDHDFNDIVLEFEKQLGREISAGTQVYCFFDEIQHFENWSAYLKKYFDKNGRLSSSLVGLPPLSSNRERNRLPGAPSKKSSCRLVFLSFFSTIWTWKKRTC